MKNETASKSLPDCSLRKLRFLCRAGQRRRGRSAASDRLRYGVEITRAYEGLVFDGAVAVLGFGGEFRLLQARVSGHAVFPVIPSQVEHAEVERVETGQRNELEFVAHPPQLRLEALDGLGVQLLLPVERRRAIVSQELSRKFGADRLGELSRLAEVRL